MAVGHAKGVYTELAGQDIRTPDELQQQYATRFPNIDLAYHSPTYGVQRGSKLDSSDLGFQTKKNSGYQAENTSGLSNYDPARKYSDSVEGKTLIQRGLAKEGDAINESAPGDNLDGLDLIPFWIQRYDEPQTKLNFRAILTGINENVSPSWSSNKFFGNPYSFYTYDGIERSVAFNFSIYCMSESELNNNWQKITELTKLTYPIIEQTNLVKPPIVQFRLGDIYYEKIAYIESLTYTLPDNGTWEIDPSVGLLPKFIDVAIGFKFIEQGGAEDAPYGLQLSKGAQDKINADRNAANTFSGNPQIATSSTPGFSPRPAQAKALASSRGIDLKLNGKPTAPKSLTGISAPSTYTQADPSKSQTKYQETIEQETRRRTLENLNGFKKPKG